MPKISIIVPVYRVEPYLDKCVQSILNQTFTDFELILVDDGSPDRCGEMCDEYAEKDSRIKVIHKENGGLSDARNAGIDAASAEYIGFVDSDDYIEKDMYEMLYDNIVKYNADVSTCGIFDHYGNKIAYHKDLDSITECVDVEKSLLLILEGKKITVNVVNKIFRRTLFSKIRFPAGKLYEDAFIMVKLFSYCKKVVYTDIPKYYYVHHENSITTEKYDEKHTELIEAYTDNLVFIKTRFSHLTKQAMFRYVWAHCVILDKMIVQKNYKDITNYKDVLLFVRKHMFFILFNTNFTLKRKLASVLLCFCPSCYRNLVIKQNKAKVT